MPALGAAEDQPEQAEKQEETEEAVREQDSRERRVDLVGMGKKALWPTFTSTVQQILWAAPRSDRRRGSASELSFRSANVAEATRRLDRSARQSNSWTLRCVIVMPSATGRDRQGDSELQPRADPLEI